MPLPVVNNRVTAANPNLAARAHLNHPIAIADNAIHAAMEGHLTWNGHIMQISAVGAVNYCYIPAFPGRVSYGVVDCNGLGGGDFYVISDQYGGCEYHELYNGNYLAFLHIYRGDGMIVPYTLAPGWTVRRRMRSAVIAQQGGMTGSNWSVSVVDTGQPNHPVQSKFIHVENMAPPHVFGQPLNPPDLRVTLEDNGDTEYSFFETGGYGQQLSNKVYNLFTGNWW